MPMHEYENNNGEGIPMFCCEQRFASYPLMLPAKRVLHGWHIDTQHFIMIMVIPTIGYYVSDWSWDVWSATMTNGLTTQQLVMMFSYNQNARIHGLFLKSPRDNLISIPSTSFWTTQSCWLPTMVLENTASMDNVPSWYLGSCVMGQISSGHRSQLKWGTDWCRTLADPLASSAQVTQETLPGPWPVSSALQVPCRRLSLWAAMGFLREAWGRIASITMFEK